VQLLAAADVCIAAQLATGSEHQLLFITSCFTHLSLQQLLMRLPAGGKHR
jgi:hypothetical protein